MKHGAEGEDIGPGIDPATLGLFRRHVGDSADDGTFGGFGTGGEVDGAGNIVVTVEIEGSAAFFTGELGEAEIENLGEAFGRDHDVGGLQVAVDDADVVSGGERVGHLHAELDGIHDRDLAGGDHGAHGLAPNEFHDDGIAGTSSMSGGHDVVDRDDIGVVEGRGRAGLLQEPGAHIRRFCGRSDEDFYGDVATQLSVASLINCTHSTFPELLENFVMGDGGADHE